MAEQTLTGRQRQVLDFIENYSNAHGYPPSVREIGKMVGLKSSSTVHSHLNSLEMKGYIKREAAAARAIVVLDKDGDLLVDATKRQPQPDTYDWSGAENTTLPNDHDIASSVVVLPLLGRVAAGEPILATGNIEDSFALPQKLVGDRGSFMLTIHGDSMVEAGINDGDYVVVREQSTADNGDYVVAMIGEDATVKTFYREPNRIRLQPENSAMEPIYLHDVRIVGKVIALLRTL
jgi:repressor LexA